MQRLETEKMLTNCGLPCIKQGRASIADLGLLLLCQEAGDVQKI